jgi:hypothetical protein
MKNIMGAEFAVALTAQKAQKANFLVRSHWDVECRDKSGKLKFVDSVGNICTDEGLNKLLDVMFHGTTPIATWYLAIYENTSPSYTPAAGDTYAVPNYLEVTDYDEATRPAFDEAAASAKSMSNTASKATFTMNASKSLYGAALVGGGSPANGKGDTGGGGVLYATALFTTPKSVESGDTFKVTCTLTASDVA